MMREELIGIAREHAAGGTRTLEDGSVEHQLPAVRDVESWEPDEWVLEAMQHAYERGLQDGSKPEDGRPF